MREDIWNVYYLNKRNIMYVFVRLPIPEVHEMSSVVRLELDSSFLKLSYVAFGLIMRLVFVTATDNF